MSGPRDGGPMESRERRTRAERPAAAPDRPEADMAEMLAVARCPACRHVLVPRLGGGRAWFGCGCARGD
ncbi:MAG: hypothetical protein ACKO9Z_02920 [Planctomycetota bacterium]